MRYRIAAFILAASIVSAQAPGDSQSKACEGSPGMPPGRAFQLLSDFQISSKDQELLFRKETDRDLIYVRFGPPDETESQPTGARGEPLVRWIYRCAGGWRVEVMFVDKTRNGNYRLAGYGIDRIGRPAGKRTYYSHGSGSQAYVEITADQKILVTIPFEFPAKQHAIAALMVSADGATNFGKLETRVLCSEAAGDSGCRGYYHAEWETPLPPGAYILSAVVEDPANSINTKTYIVNLTVDKP
jgi:hypothetical protein